MNKHMFKKKHKKHWNNQKDTKPMCEMCSKFNDEVARNITLNIFHMSLVSLIINIHHDFNDKNYFIPLKLLS